MPDRRLAKSRGLDYDSSRGGWKGIWVLVRWCIAVLAMWLGAAAAQAEDVVLLFSSPNFEGDQLRVTGDVRNLSDYDMNDEISSMIVLGGEWAIYPHKDFGGAGIRVPPGRYANMDAVLFQNNEMSSIRLVAPTRVEPPPPPKLADLKVKGEGRAGYQAEIEGEGEARIVKNLTFRGITVYVTVTNAGKADASATTLVIQPAGSMAEYLKYVSGGKHPCAEREVPWPAEAGKAITCTALKSGDVVATGSGPKLTCDIPALAVGKAARCAGTFSVLYNWVVPDFGDWSISATADSGDKAKESNEKNNGTTFTVAKDDLPPLE